MGWRRAVAQGSLGIWLVACAGSVRSGPSETIRVFGAADTPITATGVTADEDGWRIERASAGPVPLFEVALPGLEDRKSTRLNSSHLGISYAVFCLKKKNIISR